ncbi:methyl-accepting chemotaxis protein I [Alcanivorax balearicus MACL04]|uniref:Methyl-accepting chemotaxis protein I n=1 Tax=Alloalcanivorax balearicus MACL04 TaxID=1177182 RepID=A0ABT2QY65_9GAMM|nr:methyl-accepting chemotaxis protein [Alloalcanivorax balearicus]MCU5782464.1 methyl-accepting chemotaxis protein I [Alloalcanivorax balearicus MACL04]
MKWLDDMTVKRSWDWVLLGFSVMILVLGGVSLYASHFSRQAFGTLEQIHVRQTSALNRTYIDLLQAQVAMDRAAELIRVPSFDEPEPVIDEAESLMKDARQAFQRFLEIPPQPQQREAIDALSEQLYALLNVGLSLQLTVLKEGDFASYRSGRGRVSDMNYAFATGADAFLEASEESARRLTEGFEGLVRQGVAVLAVTVAAALLLVLLVRWGVTVNVIRPLQRLLTHFERIAEGDLSARLERRGNSEIGQLYAGLGALQSGLANIVGRVRKSCETLHRGSAGIANGTGNLSSRFEQLATSLEETASSMEQLTATVQRNEDHARQGHGLVRDAHRVASEGSEVMGAAVDRMERLRAAAGQIAETTSAIQGIALQTSILALNASVEAARAGEEGSGFAVVAKEVRDLARRSATLAKDIETRMEQALVEVDDGVALVGKAGGTMEHIVEAVTRVTTIMDDVAVASTEQARGIEQIGEAVVRMDQVTQQNVSVVARAADHADHLRRQADELMAAVASFTLASDGPVSPPGELEQPRLGVRPAEAGIGDGNAVA